MNNDFSDKLNSLLQNPDMMAQIKALADTMTQNGEKNGPSAPTNAAPSAESEEAESALATLQAEQALTLGGGFLSPAFEQNIKNTCALLQALKPFLDVRRREKIDKVLKMMNLAQMAGRFGNFI